MLNVVRSYESATQRSEYCLQSMEVLRRVRLSPLRFASRKWRYGECETSRKIIRAANPGRSSTSGMILGIWNAVRGARWNQIKTKLRSVRLQAHNPLLSMNFDRYKGNKRRKNRGRENKEVGGDTVS